MEIKTIASGSKGNAHLVTIGETTLLLDAGVPFKEIQAATGYNTSKITACLVTHRHGDHSKAIPQLIKRGIQVYAPSDVAEKYPGVMYIFEKTKITLGGITITPFYVPHDVPCFGWQLFSAATDEKLIYIVDAEYVPYLFTNITHLMIEANHSREKVMERAKEGKISMKLAERIIKSHMSIEAAMTFIRKNDMSRIKEIHLLHLSDDNSHAADFKRQVQEETGAEVYVC